MSDDWHKLARLARIVSPAKGHEWLEMAQELAARAPGSDQLIRSVVLEKINKEQAADEHRRNTALDASGIFMPDRWLPVIIRKAEFDYLKVDLLISFVGPRKPDEVDSTMWLRCYDTAGYSIRPEPPNLIEGAMPLRLYTDHPQLRQNLQCIPGGDGEEFDPPKTFLYLEHGDSWVIAEHFTLMSV